MPKADLARRANLRPPDAANADPSTSGDSAGVAQVQHYQAAVGDYERGEFVTYDAVSGLEIQAAEGQIVINRYGIYANGDLLTNAAPSDPTYLLQSPHARLSGAILLEDILTRSTWAGRPAISSSGRLRTFIDTPLLGRDNGTSIDLYGPLWPLTPPALADFAWVNQGGSTATETRGILYLSTPAASGANLRILARDLPAADHWRIEVMLDGQAHGVNFNKYGIGVYQAGEGATQGRCIINGLQWSSKLCHCIQQYASPTSYGGDLYVDPVMGTVPRGYAIEDDATNLIFQVTRDGINWDTVRTVGRTSYLAADQWLLFVEANNSTWGAAATFWSATAALTGDPEDPPVDPDPPDPEDPPDDPDPPVEPADDPPVDPAPDPGPDAYAVDVPAVIHGFFDWGTDYNTTHPEYGPIGANHMILWRSVNPGPGQFNWTAVEAALAAEAALDVDLWDGSTVAKPTVARLTFYLWNVAGEMVANTNGWDGTPQWVYNSGVPYTMSGSRRVGHRLSGNGYYDEIPAFDISGWRDAYYACVRAFGAQYNGDPRISAIMIQTGVDGETQVTKDGYQAWKSLVDVQVSGLQYRFKQFVLEAMGVWREAFPDTLLLIANTPGLRAETAERAAALSPVIGMQNCGLWYDAGNHWGYGTTVGSWSMYAQYQGILPMWIESAYGFGSAEQFYWGWLAGLHYHPVGADVHAEWYETSSADVLEFVGRHLAATKATTPDVWTALRNMEYPLDIWGEGNGYSGKPGDWQFWLYRTTANTVYTRAQLPVAAQGGIYSRQARKVDATHSLGVAVDTGVHFYGDPATVEAISYGALTLGGNAGTVTDLGNNWRRTTWTGVTATSIVLASEDAYVHMVRVIPE
jgi:hypothetical protein